MTISARIIADSAQEVLEFRDGKWVPTGSKNRLTTMVLRYPRFIHAEFMTHRVFSRNASSSRAIPIQKMIDAVKNDPAMPVFWGKNQAGMQAAVEVGGQNLDQAKSAWLSARDCAVEAAEEMDRNGLHKQIANRVLEPWMHIEVVVTATDWANFYALRLDKAAQPEMRALAQAANEAHIASFPRVLKPGEWHLPFITGDEMGRLEPDVLCRVSAARCARVSYLKHDGTKSTTEEDMELFDRLMGGEIKHSSPTEHQAMVPTQSDLTAWNQGGTGYLEEGQSNLHGWYQFRKTIKGENVRQYKEFTR